MASAMRGGVPASSALEAFRSRPTARTLGRLAGRLAAEDRAEKRALVTCDVALVLWWTGLEPDEVAEALWGDDCRACRNGERDGRRG